MSATYRVHTSESQALKGAKRKRKRRERERERGETSVNNGKMMANNKRLTIKGFFLANA